MENETAGETLELVPPQVGASTEAETPAEGEVHAEGDVHAETGTDEHGADAAGDHAATGGETHAGTEAGHSDIFPPFDPASFGPQLFWLALTFIVLYVVVSRVALPRIGGIIESRNARIAADLATADASRQKTDAAIASYEAALAAARARSQNLADETRTRIRADIEQRRHAVESDLAARVASAEASIATSKREALGHVEEIATDTVQALVLQLTGSVTPEEARAAVAAASKE